MNDNTILISNDNEFYINFNSSKGTLDLYDSVHLLYYSKPLTNDIKDFSSLVLMAERLFASLGIKFDEI